MGKSSVQGCFADISTQEGCKATQKLDPDQTWKAHIMHTERHKYNDKTFFDAKFALGMTLFGQFPMILVKHPVTYLPQWYFWPTMVYEMSRNFQLLPWILPARTAECVQHHNTPSFHSTRYSPLLFVIHHFMSRLDKQLILMNHWMPWIYVLLFMHKIVCIFFLNYILVRVPTG